MFTISTTTESLHSYTGYQGQIVSFSLLSILHNYLFPVKDCQTFIDVKNTIIQQHSYTLIAQWQGLRQQAFANNNR